MRCRTRLGLLPILSSISLDLVFVRRDRERLLPGRLGESSQAAAMTRSTVRRWRLARRPQPPHTPSIFILLAFATVTPVQALPLPEAMLGRRHPPHPLCTPNLSFRFRPRLLIGVDPQPKHEHRSRQASSTNSATGAWLPCGLNLGARQQSNQRGELWLWMRGG